MAFRFSSIFRRTYLTTQSSLSKSLLPSLSTTNHSLHQLSTTHFSSTTSYQHILTETRENNIGLITLNRPTALNALCKDLLDEIVSALQSFENNDNISAIIITGAGGTLLHSSEISFNFTKTLHREGILCRRRHQRNGIQNVHGRVQRGHV